MCVCVRVCVCRPANDFRLFVGDLGNEVTTEMLAKEFQKYKTFAKAKVQYNTTLHYTVLHYATLYCTTLCTALHSALHYTLHYTLHCTTLCTALHSALHSTLHYTLHCTAVYTDTFNVSLLRYHTYYSASLFHYITTTHVRYFTTSP